MQSDKPVVPISLWGPPMVRREQARPPESTTPETICGLKVHPVANMFPLLEGDDLKQMRDSIRENGQRIPVIVDGDTLLEGRNPTPPRCQLPFSRLHEGRRGGQ